MTNLIDNDVLSTPVIDESLSLDVQLLLWKGAYLTLAEEFRQEKQLNRELRAELALAREEFSLLKEQVLMLRHQLFGKKGEAFKEEELAANVSTAGPVDSEAGNNEDLVENSTIEVSGYTRGKRGTKSCGRTIDTGTLPHYAVYHELSGEQQICTCCGKSLERLEQYDVSEQLEILPKLLYVVKHIRYKYVCRPCGTLQMALKEPSPIPKSLAGSSLITDVIINKYQHHQPLYRQAKIFLSYKVSLPANTLGNWVMQSGSSLKEILEPTMWKATLSINYLQVDETPIKILQINKKGYAWLFLAPYIGEHGLIMVELSLTRSGIVAEKRLQDFKGPLQTDAYPGYDNLRKSEKITGFGCLTHARRKFSEVIKVTKKKEQNSTTTKVSYSIAAEFITRVKPLYELEEKMDALGVNFHTKKRLRQKQSWPIFKALLRWLKQQRNKVPPKSKLGAAIQYTLKQWKFIIAYLRHGIVRIDTNWVENKIRPIALGRKDWLFMDNADSGGVNAFLFSLILSAEMNGLNSRIYLHYLLSNLHKLRKGIIKAENVLPHTIKAEILDEFSAQQSVLAKEIMNKMYISHGAKKHIKQQ